MVPFKHFVSLYLRLAFIQTLPPYVRLLLLLYILKSFSWCISSSGAGG